MGHDLWIFVRVVSGLWLLGVFLSYARDAYCERLSLSAGFFAFLVCCFAFLNAANWW